MYKNYGLKLKRHYSSLFIYVFAITIVVVVMSLGGVASVLFIQNDSQNDKVELVYEVNYERIDENTGKVKWDFKDENEYVEFLTFKDLSDNVDEVIDLYSSDF